MSSNGNGHYDVIIIGSGAGGGTLAHRLAPSGKKVLLIERGPFVPREKENWSTKAVNQEARYNTRESWLDRDGHALHPHTNYFVGGNTKFYGAALFRMRAEDFGTLRHHCGVSPAWPISYSEMEPYYTEAEHLYEVHGERGGHPLEIIWFPKGKGDPRWQREGAPLFMGIDHTAIVVSDTDASLRFWRDTLGLRIAGASENYGTEQEHLNNVFGARLRITGLRAPKGPGIEFLEYLAPRDGKPYPADEKANDLVHWQTQLAVAKATDAEAAVRAARVPLVSPGAVEVPGAGAGLVVRDPDGHAVELMESAGR